MRPSNYVLAIGTLALIAGCSTYDPMLKTGANDRPTHEIQVVEDTMVMEIAMTQSESGIPYYRQSEMKAFLADYKNRGARHGPLILSVPQNSPLASQHQTGTQQALELAYEFGVKDVKRSDYDSGGAAEAPLVLAYTAYKAIAPDCPSLASIDLTGSTTNDVQPRFGCAMQANLAAMIADPADLIGTRRADPADTVRRVDVLTKYRAGQSTITERTESESGTISDAVN